MTKKVAKFSFSAMKIIYEYLENKNAKKPILPALNKSFKEIFEAELKMPNKKDALEKTYTFLSETYESVAVTLSAFQLNLDTPSDEQGIIAQLASIAVEQDEKYRELRKKSTSLKLKKPKGKKLLMMEPSEDIMVIAAAQNAHLNCNCGNKINEEQDNRVTFIPLSKSGGGLITKDEAFKDMNELEGVHPDDEKPEYIKDDTNFETFWEKGFPQRIPIVPLSNPNSKVDALTTVEGNERLKDYQESLDELKAAANEDTNK
eukprot:CAMPEP_0204616024 /NCGR_PEP_ID=MMETSP0717-20131115/3368_1 /ASSEMBLY_ACC=CAM_ASM_000666 /TAXON_ID=230516 /ORGANISM="Chaetoceros curvisetus" /LENGTH=259 /DNA_ID=CAMNT_0051629119 /DNA_START=89 /DNA_END=865 /DNA_ORIENTATION=+